MTSSIEGTPPLAAAAVPMAQPKARWLALPVSASLAGAVLLSSWALAGASRTAVGASLSAEVTTGISAEISIDDPLARGPSAKVAPDSTPTGPTVAADHDHKTRWPMPVWDGIPLDEVYPSLRGWIHPVTDAKEIVPDSGSRRFGSRRDGILRDECGAGHCGVDLDGPRGQPMVAVAAGKVVRVEHSELGRDGRSGRYVRIEHNDGTLTAYMHLDEIAEGISVGDRVDAGQYIGTLGATAIFSSRPHCHFSLELPLDAGTHGDNTKTRYIDPSPFLARSRVVQPMRARENSAGW